MDFSPQPGSFTVFKDEDDACDDVLMDDREPAAADRHARATSTGFAPHPFSAATSMTKHIPSKGLADKTNHARSLKVDTSAKPSSHLAAPADTPAFAHFAHPFPLASPLTSPTVALDVDADATRIVVIENLTQDRQRVIMDMIRGAGQVKSIHHRFVPTQTTPMSAFAAPFGPPVTTESGTASFLLAMAVIYFNVQHAQACLASLSQYDAQHAAATGAAHLIISYSTDAAFISSFSRTPLDIPPTCIYVSMQAPQWRLKFLDYLSIFRAEGDIRAHREVQWVDQCLVVMLEYQDTRVTGMVHDKFHRISHQGIRFETSYSPPNSIISTPAAFSLTVPLLSPVSPFNDMLPPVINPTMSRSASDPLVLGAEMIMGMAVSGPSMSNLQAIWATDVSRASSMDDTLACSPIHPLSSEMDLPSTQIEHPAVILMPSISEASQTTPSRRPKRPLQSQAHNATRNSSSASLPASIHSPRPLSYAHVVASTPVQGILPPPSGLSQSSSSSTNSANASMTGIAPSQRVTPLSGPMANSNAFKLDLAKISKGQDKRTTFMIRNIPNKYTQEMIRSWIDTTHKGTYDFLYLPIDFENKCNIGYAFINFMEPRFVVTFAQTRLGKHWAQFNSEKKCDLAYARLQGKANLIQRFRNSDIMQQDVSYQPILFHSSGPNKGMPEAFPRRDSNEH